jgi:hypothetical protein
MLKSPNRPSSVVMEEVTDPTELEQARRQRERFDRNADWLQRHVPEIYRKHRGKFICVAGEELFVGDTVEEAVQVATAAHPDDDGMFTRYIPQKKVPRIYEIQRTLVASR